MDGRPSEKSKNLSSLVSGSPTSLRGYISSSQAADSRVVSIVINRIVVPNVFSFLDTDNFRAAGFPSTNKSSGCWNPLQGHGVHDERSESVIYTQRRSPAGLRQLRQEGATGYRPDVPMRYERHGACAICEMSRRSKHGGVAGRGPTQIFDVILAGGWSLRTCVPRT